MTFIIIIFEVQYNDLYFLRKLFNELQLGSISEDLKEPYQFPFLGKSIVLKGKNITTAQAVKETKQLYMHFTLVNN